MACSDHACIALWNSNLKLWDIFSDCTGDCNCPSKPDDGPPAGMNGLTLVKHMFCVGDVGPGQEATFGIIQWADSWVMQSKCAEFVMIGCEWSMGDGKVKQTGFQSNVNRPQVPTLQGDRPEIVILGGMKNGLPNTANGLPDPWIIGYAQWMNVQSKSPTDYRINVAGLTSFSVKGKA